jgi:hypothetical protein
MPAWATPQRHRIATSALLYVGRPASGAIGRDHAIICTTKYAAPSATVVI